MSDIQNQPNDLPEVAETPTEEVVQETLIQVEESPAAAAPVAAIPTQRVFVVSGTRIVEDATTTGMSIEQVRGVLKSQYPEVANATHRTYTQDNMEIHEFLPQPGRKG